MKKTTLAIMTVLLLLCMCLPVGFEQPSAVNDITNQTSARNDDTNQQPGENQTATDLCQDLPPEHETTEGVWVCDPDGKTVDEEGNVIEWQWHGDELPITRVGCEEPTEDQHAATNLSSVPNKELHLFVGGRSSSGLHVGYVDSVAGIPEAQDLGETEGVDELNWGTDYNLKKIVWRGFHFSRVSLNGAGEISERPENSEFEGQSGIRVEYEIRYVEDATEENGVTNNISWEFIIFPERVEISSSGSNPVQMNAWFGAISGGVQPVGTANRQWSDEGIQIATENSRIHIVPSHDEKSEDAIELGIIVALVDSDSSQSAIANEMRFVFDAVEDNSTTNNQTLDGIEYELAEMNIIERKLCDVPEADDGKEEAESKDEGVFMKLGSSEVMNRDMAVGASVAIVTLLLSALVRSGGGGLLPRMVDKSDMVD